MTPQLQQAIKLLQLNRLELVHLVQQEMQENPVLEESEGGDEDSGELDGGAEAASSSADAAESASPADSGEGSPESADPVEAKDSTEASDAEKIADIEWENYMDSHPQTRLESRGARLRGSTAASRGDADPAPDACRASSSGRSGSLHSIRPRWSVAHWILGNLDEKRLPACLGRGARGASPVRARSGSLPRSPRCRVWTRQVSRLGTCASA